MSPYDREAMRQAARVRNMTGDEVVRDYRTSDDPVVSALAQFIEDVSNEVAFAESERDGALEQLEEPCEECRRNEETLEKLEDAHQDAVDKKDEEIAHLNERINEFAAESATKTEHITTLEKTMSRTIEDRLTDIENTLARVVLMIEARSGDPVASPVKEPGTKAKTDKPKAVSKPKDAPSPDEDEQTLSMEDLRGAFLEAVKVSGKDPAKSAVLDNAPGAKKLPDVAAEHYQAVYDALSALAQREAA